MQQQQNPNPNQNPTPPPNLSGVSATLKDLQSQINSAFASLGDVTANLDRSFATVTASMAGTFGQTQRALVGLRQELAIALPGIEGLGGDMKDVANIQLGIAQSLNRNVVTLGETTSDLFTAGKAVGVASENVGSMVLAFQNAGIQTTNIKDNIQDTVDIARQVGVNTSAVFQLVQQNLGKLNEYGFQDGAAGLARMSAQAASLRIDMREVFGFAERVFNPEGAIEMVASFQRLGVAAGDLADPFRLMYLASEDTEELQNQIVKMTEQFTYFDESTKEFKVFPNAKRDLREIAKETGIAYDELVKMSIGQQKLNAIQKDFRISGIDSESQQFVANLAEFSKEKGGFTVQVEGQEKLVSELNPDDIEKLRKQQEPVTLEDIAEAQLTEQELANALLDKILASVAAPAAGARPLQDTRERIRGALGGTSQMTTSVMGNTRGGIESINNQYNQFGSTISNILSGEGSLEQVFTLLKGAGGDMMDGFTQITTKLSSFNFDEVGEKYISSGNQIKAAAESAVEGFMKVSEAGKNFILETTGVTSKADVTVSPQVTKVEIADINYKGTVDVNLNMAGGALANVPNMDKMAYDLFSNPTFQKGMSDAIQNAVRGSNYSLVPNTATT